MGHTLHISIGKFGRIVLFERPALDDGGSNHKPVLPSPDGIGVDGFKRSVVPAKVQTTQRYVTNLQILDISPAKKSDGGEPVWKLKVQFPWSQYTDILYLPRKEGMPVPQTGEHSALLERTSHRMDTNGNDDADYLWRLMEIDPRQQESVATEEAPPIHQQNGKASNGIASSVQKLPMFDTSVREAPLRAQAARSASAQLVEKPPVVDRSALEQEASLPAQAALNASDQSVEEPPVVDRSALEQEASLRSQTALNASAQIVSGFLAASGQKTQRDYSWKDMIEIATAVADAFVVWLDDSTKRQVEGKLADIEAAPQDEGVKPHDNNGGMATSHINGSTRESPDSPHVASTQARRPS